MGGKDLYQKAVAVTPSYELLLLLAAVGFYVYDSAMLLYADELIFRQQWNGCWSFQHAGTTEILGKNPYIPNPLTPGAAILRVSFALPLRAEQDNEEQKLKDFLDELKLVRYLVTALHLLLVIGLPLILFRFRNDESILLFLAATYLAISAMAVELCRLREIARIPANKLIGLVFELFACPPLAINLLRKLTLAKGLTGDPIRFARRQFSPDSFNGLAKLVCTRLDELAADAEVPDVQVNAYRERVAAMTR